MRSLALFLTFAVFGLASPHLNDQWEAWRAEFQKVYTDEAEAVYRRAVWEKKWRLVRRHNLEAEAGNSPFTLGLNQLSDMSTDEVNAKLNRLKEEDPASFDSWISTRWDKGVEKVPESVDWRQYGLVSPVQNQGKDCGSCWAFSAVGALEGQMARKTGVLVPLSPQNLMDCCLKNNGCDGGKLSNAFQYVIDNDGIDSWKYYPYEEKVGDCRYSSRGRAGNCVSFTTVRSGNEMALQAAVAELGPVSVGINAGLDSFHQYKEGVYDPPDCGTETNTHAVLVVGYDTDQGQDYWIVKNSWGSKWGEQGYIRMARNKNLCGIARQPIYPIVDNKTGSPRGFSSIQQPHEEM
ncbi:procathepsin L-like [Gadus chalcogrammus]|uniref:procathepsin L-like n=1 Tax=Gadus chalcogrammus TaxID=1042646 RepID=UPI0024C4A3A0|nr:procathepsin L-like [Gadus chalcogrammus]